MQDEQLHQELHRQLLRQPQEQLQQQQLQVTDRSLLFNVAGPFEIPEDEFEKLWPLVTNVWTQFSSGFPGKGDEWIVYACRFLKHRRSSTRQDGVEVEKRRKTKVRDSQLCFAKIRITKISASG